MQRTRLIWQLYPAFLLITLVSVLVVTLYASLTLREFHLQQTKEGLESRARLVQDEVRRLVRAGDALEVDRMCKRLGKQSATRITVILPSGKVIGDAEETPEKMDNHAGRPEIRDAFLGTTGSSVRYSDTLKKRMAYLAIPVKDDGQVLCVLRTSVPLAALAESSAATYISIVLAALLVAVLAAALSMVVSRRIIRPLEMIRQGAERFARGDLTHKLTPPNSQEVASLAETLNQMAAELDERIRTVVGQRNERDAMLASMMEGVLAVDSQQHVLGLNRAAAEVFGVSVVESPGKLLPEIVRSAALQELVTMVLQGGAPISEEITLPGDPARILHVHGTVLRGPEGDAIGALLVWHDVTRMKKLENIRRDFVANVSHELKTPITSIKGYVETLLQGALDRREDAQRFLEIVASQSDRLDAIIDDLLALSRLEREEDRSEIELEHSRIGNVLEAAVAASQTAAAANEITIQRDCPEELATRVNAPLLEQAVANLIDNACKYSPPKSTVWVDAAEENGEVVIRVRDRGCGIDRQHLDRIFERFYRVDKARSRKLGGTGLGLAIVKHIVHAHAGRVDVESVRDQGSTFTIYMPLATGADKGETR
jgi:two-component system phosphate regulon sensor histidine kinase PhoR